MQLASTTIEIFQCYYFRTCSIGSIANLGYVANFSKAEKFRSLYSYYSSCMPSSSKDDVIYITPIFGCGYQCGSLSI